MNKRNGKGAFCSVFCSALCLLLLEGYFLEYVLCFKDYYFNNL